MSIAVKTNLMSALQAFSLGGGWPRKAPRMPQDGRSPGGFIWETKHKPMLPYGHFSYQGRPKSTESLDGRVFDARDVVRFVYGDVRP
jgi:hypothetical protein